MRAIRASLQLALLATLTLGVAGCDEILGVGREERTAVLVTDSALTLDRKGALVLEPDTAAAGAVVTIRVRTAGGGCTRRAFIETRNLVDALELRPYNSYPTGNVACTADFRIIEHVVTQQFFTRGAKRIRAVGVSFSGALVSVEDTLVVR